MTLTHLNAAGEASMVDVGDKAVTERSAVASGTITMRAETFDLLAGNQAPKGDVLAAARIAGIMGSKKTSDLIPLCHPVALTTVSIAFTFERVKSRVIVTATAKTRAKTGVEMEALTAVSVACLTLYDMLKASDKAMHIDGIRLLSKTGGRSGEYSAEAGLG